MRSLVSITLILAVLGFSFIGYAQANKETKIVLKNGVKIHGAILESMDDEYLKVRISESAEPLLLNYDHIKKISFRGNGSLNRNIKEQISSPPGLQLNTFYHEFRGGLLFGNENISGGLHTINGYQFNQYLGTGVGVGLNKFGNYISLPIYASVKGYILDQKVSPFYFGDIGYGLAWSSDKENNGYTIENVKGGLYWQLGAGYQFNFYNSSFVITLGYVNQSSSSDYRYDYFAMDGVEVSEKRLLRRVNLTIGMLF
jgi:hypothetical protein